MIVLLQIAPLPPMPPGQIPFEVVMMAKMFFTTIAIVALGVPLIRGLSRRFLERPPAPAPLSSDVAERLTRIEQAVDAIAVEVERVSEGQRYTTRLMTEMRGALPPGEPRTPR